MDQVLPTEQYLPSFEPPQHTWIIPKTLQTLNVMPSIKKLSNRLAKSLTLNHLKSPHQVSRAHKNKPVLPKVDELAAIKSDASKEMHARELSRALADEPNHTQTNLRTPDATCAQELNEPLTKEPLDAHYVESTDNNTPQQLRVHVNDSALGTLPPELRRQVYELVFADEKSIILVPDGQYGWVLEEQSKQPKRLALLRTCKAVRDEYALTFYSTNNFTLSAVKPMEVQSCLESFRSLLGAFNASALRSVTIDTGKLAWVRHPRGHPPIDTGPSASTKYTSVLSTLQEESDKLPECHFSLTFGVECVGDPELKFDLGISRHRGTWCSSASNRREGMACRLRTSTTS